MHTFFALEDMYGLKIGEIDGEVCLHLDKNHEAFQHMLEPFIAWQHIRAKLDSGEISQEEYDRWRYKYPAFDTDQKWAKVPSQEFMDFLTDGLK